MKIIGFQIMFLARLEGAPLSKAYELYVVEGGRLITQPKNFILKSIATRRLNMSRMCEICGKKPMVGNNVSHAHNVTKRRFNPNLQRVRTISNGSVKKMVVCTNCIKSGSVVKAP